MAVDFNGLFYQPRPAPVDNAPTVQAGAVRGNAYANIGQSIGSGLIQRAKMQEEKRQFDIQMTVRKALAHAQEVKDQAIAAHQQSQERMQALRDFDNQQHQGVMESQGQQRIALEDQRYQTQQQQFDRAQSRMEMDARQRSDEAAFARVHQEAEAGAAKKLADEMFQRGDLTDQEHALASMQLDSGDPVQVRRAAQGMVAKSKVMDQRAIDDDLRKVGPKELIQTLTDKRKGLEEAGIKVDPEQFLEARALAVSFARSHSSGPALASEFKQLQAKMAGVGTAKAGKSSEPKITLASGRQVADPTGLSKGGTFDRMTPAQQTTLLGLGAEEAQHDPNWPKPEAAIATAMLKKGSQLTQQEMADAIASVPTLQQNMAIEKANQIATTNGWTAGEQPAQQASGGDPAETLRAEVESGKIKTDAELEARAKELGVTLK